MQSRGLGAVGIQVPSSCYTCHPVRAYYCFRSSGLDLGTPKLLRQFKDLIPVSVACVPDVGQFSVRFVPVVTRGLYKRAWIYSDSPLACQVQKLKALVILMDGLTNHLHQWRIAVKQNIEDKILKMSIPNSLIYYFSNYLLSSTYVPGTA